MARIIILSGAGLSAESGISTFRDSGGVWENHSVFDVCSADSLEKNLELTLDFYNQRRVQLQSVEPNYAHKVISDLKKKYPEICVITQNVDDLFERSGCNNVIHLHGFLTQLKCTNKACDYKIDIGYTEQKEQKCEKCSSDLRPDIVFFGEEAPYYQELYKELKDCELLVVIGTSGEVLDINYLSRGIKHTILNNLEPSRAIKTKKFTKVLYKPATEAIDEIKEDIEYFILSQYKCVEPDEIESKITTSRKYCDINHIQMDDETINYIATITDNNVLEIERKLSKLYAFSKLMNRNITLDFTKNALKS